MKAVIGLTVVCGLINRSAAHFAVGHLLVNGTDTGLWKHVLKVAHEHIPSITDPTNHFGQVTPQFPSDLSTTNITCGRSAFDSLPTTEIADVVAGEELGFRLMSAEEVNAGGGYGYIFHPGPAQIWLSRAPNDDMKAYHGDGDWFKVSYGGPKNNWAWELRDPDAGFSTEFNFTLPRTTPPGKYLLRWEYIYVTSLYNYTQWYINCALVNVQSPPGVTPGTPKGFAKFPGAYNIEDPGLWLPKIQDVENGLPREQLRLMEYKAPGPAIWEG
ncbi:lytic polysaccharide monooxygenase [Amniculicola lignicola CBS 123094]|uniref:lytic cellulose monooxygenase (C4-dehydrogenating) n=1 Tax=Amniculicola lignicola CBS 123094 TaxID=1392246 RepID=A0A6A5X0Z2_9PLEO|nr:lytic polysaccharide monooxygenase [Amniculicola lignicola CBS 123094]